MGEHTPTPWKIDARQFSQHGLMHISCGHYIVAQALGQTATCESEAEANAAFIVEAVNSYDRNRATIEALVSALEECKSFLRDLTDPDATATGANIIASYANAISLRIKVVNALAEVKKGETP